MFVALAHILSDTPSNTIECFNIARSVTDPTHERGHILDLVLSYGFADFARLPHPTIWHLPPSAKRHVKSSTASHFIGLPFSDSYSQPDIDELVGSFNSACTSALDTTAPKRECRNKAHFQPWFNKNTRMLRQIWRRAERKWKKGRLQVSYYIIVIAPLTNRTLLKEPEVLLGRYWVSTHHRPRVLYNTINSFINPPTGCTGSLLQQWFVKNIYILSQYVTFLPYRFYSLSHFKSRV